MAYHEWGDEGVDWDAINGAASLLASFCRRWGKFLCNTKEKYGTVRCSPYFMMTAFYTPNNPWYYKMLDKLPLKIQSKIYNIGTRYQAWILYKAYVKVLRTFPHISEEIMDDCPFYSGMFSAKWAKKYERNLEKISGVINTWVVL